MKKFLRLLSICAICLMAGNAHAETSAPEANEATGYTNYFVPGTEWIQVPLNSLYSFNLREIPGSQIMILGPKPGEPEDDYCYIKTEGDKVYFHLLTEDGSVPSADAEDWYLAYDFGLQVGESCTAYSIMYLVYNNPPENCRSTFTCLEINPANEEYNNLPTMTMASPVEGHPEYGRTGVWIMGIGDARGVDRNSNYNLIGTNGGNLLEVIGNGQTLYFTHWWDPLDYYWLDGTVWDVVYYPDFPEMPDYMETFQLVSANNNDSNPYLMKYAESGQSIVYIKVDDHKAYFHLIDGDGEVPDPDGDGWYLMYDMSVVPGQNCTVYWPQPMINGADPEDCKTTFICKDLIWEDEDCCYRTTLVMTEPSDNLPEEEWATGKWIMALGDERGVLSNQSYYLDGCPGSKLTKCYFNAPSKVYLFYDLALTGVESVAIKEGPALTLNGRELTVSSANDANERVYIYGIDGKTVASGNLNASRNFSVLLPASGLYLVKVGNSSKKIMVK